MTALIFDLDGTLVDSAPDLRVACNRVLAIHGRLPITLEQTRRFIGSGARVLIRHAFDASGGSPEDLDQAHRDFLAAYGEAPATHTTVYPGVRTTLAELSQHHRLGLCTNKPIELTERVLEAYRLRDFFGDAVVGGGSVSVKKPHALPLVATLERLGADWGVMIGDSGADVGAARNAGLPCVAVEWGYSLGEAKDLGADAVISRFPDLLAVLPPLLARRDATRPGRGR